MGAKIALVRSLLEKKNKKSKIKIKKIKKSKIRNQTVRKQSGDMIVPNRIAKLTC